MIAKFNRRLRVVMLAVGALFLILKLSVGSAEDEKKSAKRGENGFQTEEFDDIW